MCVQIKTIFRCSCPYQNEPICPHHIYIRSSQAEIDCEEAGTLAEDDGDGFQLRLASALQAHRDWTPLPQDGDSPYPRWDHCSVYKSKCRGGVADPKEKGKGKEHVLEGKEYKCPNWVRTEESVSRLVRDLCVLCEDSHGIEPEEEERPEEKDSEFTVDYIRNRAAGSRSSNRSGTGGVSTQTPVRRILSQVKQKIIRESLMGGQGQSSRSSSAAGDNRRTSGEGKEGQGGDVFSRLQVADSARKRGTSLGSMGSGTRTGTPDKGRPSSRQTAKKPAWGGGGGGGKKI